MVYYTIQGDEPEEIRYIPEHHNEIMDSMLQNIYCIEIKYKIFNNDLDRIGTNRIIMKIGKLLHSTCDQWMQNVESYFDFATGSIHFFSSFKILKHAICDLNINPSISTHIGKGTFGNVLHKTFRIEMTYKNSYPHQFSIEPNPIVM